MELKTKNKVRATFDWEEGKWISQDNQFALFLNETSEMFLPDYRPSMGHPAVWCAYKAVESMGLPASSLDVGEIPFSKDVVY